MYLSHELNWRYSQHLAFKTLTNSCVRCYLLVSNKSFLSKYLTLSKYKQLNLFFDPVCIGYCRNVSQLVHVGIEWWSQAFVCSLTSQILHDRFSRIALLDNHTLHAWKLSVSDNEYILIRLSFSEKYISSFVSYVIETDEKLSELGFWELWEEGYFR